MSESVPPLATSSSPATPSRASTGSHRAVVAISIGLAAVVGAGFGRVIQGSNGTTLAAASTERIVDAMLHQRLAAFGVDRPLVVHCPNEPARAGHVFVCTVAGLTASPYQMHVGEVDANDHFRLLPTAPG